MARLRKLGKGGNYYIVFHDVTRKPKEKSVPLQTTRKEVAMQRFTARLEEYERGDLDPWAGRAAGVKPTTAAAAVERFLLDSSQANRPKTTAAYRSVLESVLLPTLPPGIGVAHIDEKYISPLLYGAKHFRTGEPLKPATLRHRYRHLKAFFSWCCDAGLIKKNPMDRIKPPKAGERVPEFLTPADLERLFRCIDADFEINRGGGHAREGEVMWLKDLVLFAVNTGCRLGEIISLRWQDVDFDSGFITVRNRDGFQTKSGHERAIPLSSQAMEVLQRLGARRADQLDGYVFTSQSGGQLNAGYASKRFKHYVRKAKLPEYIRFHSLRHTCASWLVQNGTPIAVVQAVLGHGSSVMTERYSHLAPGVMTAAIRGTFG